MPDCALKCYIESDISQLDPRKSGEEGAVLQLPAKSLVCSGCETGLSGHTAALCKEKGNKQRVRSTELPLVEQHRSIKWPGINPAWELEHSGFEAASKINKRGPII